MSVISIIREGKEKPVGVLVTSAVFMFFGSLCIVGSILFIALALSMISQVEGVVYTTGGNGGAIVGIFYFGAAGFIQLYTARGIWRLKVWARNCALILAGLALISIVFDLIGEYTGVIIDVALLPKFKFPIICLIISLLIIFMLYLETHKGTFREEQKIK